MSEPKTILLIDDEEDLIYMMKSLLTRAGYNVITASNGEEGLAKLKQTSPHLIILDMNMPKMGGIAFYHAIASTVDAKPAYPVLVLTARANLEKTFKDFEVDGFMNKPFEIGEFLSEVQSILMKRDARTQSGGPKDPDSDPLKKVLIMEDLVDVSGPFVIAMMKAGYLVSVSPSGAVGIDQALRKQPDIILIKLELPDFRGDIIASKLRQMLKTMDIPVVLYTFGSGHCDELSVNASCRKMGIHDLLRLSDSAGLLKEVDALFRPEAA